MNTMKTQLSIQVFPGLPPTQSSSPCGASEPRRTTRLLAGLRVKPLDDPVDGVKAIAWG